MEPCRCAVGATHADHHLGQWRARLAVAAGPNIEHRLGAEVPIRCAAAAGARARRCQGAVELARYAVAATAYAEHDLGP